MINYKDIADEVETKSIGWFKEVASSEDWMVEGSCSNEDVSIWYVPDRKQAKEICGGCPVLMECAVYSSFHKVEHGVWGGLSELGRENLRKELKDTYAEIKNYERPTIHDHRAFIKKEA